MADITLVEGERRESVSLSPDEVAALRASDLADVAPGWEVGQYTLTARALVGHIVLPTRQVVVRPKIPLANVFAMLARAAGEVRTTAEDATFAEGEPILAGVADLYAGALDALLAAGGVREAVDVTEETPFVRGKLLLAATLRQPPARRHLPVTRRNAWSMDTPLNQLLKQAARLPLGLNLPWHTRARLERAVAEMDEVADTTQPLDAFERVRLTRQTGGARPALVLARWIVLGCAPSLDAGPHAFPAFRLDLARLFEEFVAALVQEEIAGDGLRVTAQPLLPLDEAGDVPLRPDLVVWRRGQPRLVLDTKYKLPGPPQPDDLYQLLTYCHALGAPTGGLVLPTPATGAPLVVRQTGVVLHALGVDLGAPPAAFPAACRKLTDSIHALVER